MKRILAFQNISLGIVQEIEVSPYEQILNTQPRVCPGEWDAKTHMGFWDTNISPTLREMTRPCDNQQRKRTCKIVEFVVLANPKVKLKESEKKDKYLDIDTELKKKNGEHESNSDTNCNWHAQ